MPRISRLGRNEVSESVGAIYDRYMRQRGNVPNMFRTVALMAASGLFNYFNRFNNLLAMEPTKPAVETGVAAAV